MRRLTIFALSALLLLSAGAATAQATSSPCLSSNGQVCSAHGTCVTNPVGQYCACLVGYEGFQCQRVAAPSTSCTTGAMNGVPCSGHGTCQGTPSPSCVCAADFIGPQCQFLANQANACIAPSGQVCNQHGTCMSTSAGEYCACYLNFTGAQCQTPVKGISRVMTMTVTRVLTETTSDNVGGGCLGSNGAACSGNGNCVNGECDCSNGYYGQYCQYFASACVNTTNGMVCSGNGRCSVSSSGAATCTCFLGYAGTMCETPVTNMPVPVPVPTTSSNCTVNANGAVCSGNGICYNGVCECSPGYYGQYCQSEHNATNSCTGPNGLLCSGQGTCMPAPNGDFLCVCAAPWAGHFCTVNATQCTSANGVVCSGHGQCVSNGSSAVCLCYAGWAGLTCQSAASRAMTMTVTRLLTETTSDNIGGGCLGNNGAACSGNGICVNSECDCSNGYYGQYCQYYASACVNATNGMVCSGNGRCSVSSSGAATCTCFLGYAGTMCETPVTNMPVPVPVPTTTSNCTVNANGAVCSGNGICYNGVCACNPGFYGQYCQSEHNATNSCTGPNGLLCSGQGTCMPAPNGDFFCVCAAPWAGHFCTVNATQCTSANGVVCSSHGQCVSNGSSAVCLCYAGWAGLTCQSAASRAMTVTVTRLLTETTSDNIGGGCLGNNGAACSGNGICLDGACGCAEGYFGQYCQYRETPIPAPSCSTASPNGVVCSGHGQCTLFAGVMQCQCTVGWVGVQCEAPFPTDAPVTTTGLPQQAVGSAADDTTALLPKTIGIAAIVAAVVALLVLGVGVVLLRKRRGASAQAPREEGKNTVSFIAADDSPVCEMTPAECAHIGVPMLV